MNDIAKRVFAIPAEVEMLLEQAFEEKKELGEVSPQLLEELNRAVGSLDQLKTEVAGWQMYSVGKKTGREAELKPLIKDLQKELKDHADKVEFIEYLLEKLIPPGPNSAFVNDRVAVYYSPSEATEPVDAEAEEATPIEFCETKYVPDKKKIKAAIEEWNQKCWQAKKAGEKEPPHPCPGWRIKQNWNLKVTLGGPGAQKNAKSRAKDREEIGATVGQQELPGGEG